jgi:hypothetical protein
VDHPQRADRGLKGIGSALGGKDVEDPTDKWVDTGEVLPTAFEETTLEDPAKALAEARGQAAGASAEAEGHATTTQRRAQAYGRPAADSLEDQASALHDSELDIDSMPPSPDEPGRDLPSLTPTSLGARSLVRVTGCPGLKSLPCSRREWLQGPSTPSSGLAR